MQQDVSPNLNVVGEVGGCLKYVRTMFGAPGGVDYAWQAWENAIYRHGDQNFPNASVPCFFSYTVNNLDEGHVVTHVPGQGFYSSPYSTRTNAEYQDTAHTHALLPSIAEIERIYHVTFVGWTEDINGVRVAQPIPVAPPAPLYTITPITPKQVLVAAGCKEWNLNQADFAAVAASPFTTAGDNHIITVVAALQHREIPQYSYYLEDANTPLGWNTLDCTDYIPPIVLAPVVTPDPVVTKPYTPPAAPVVVPLATKYTVKDTLVWFSTAEDAQNRLNPKRTIKAGPNYYHFADNGTAVNIGPDNMHNLYWINGQDNVAPAPVVVTPEPVAPIVPAVTQTLDSEATIRASFRPFTTDGSSIELTVSRDITIFDVIHPNVSIKLEQGNDYKFFGYFKANGRWYAQPRMRSDVVNGYYMLGCPIDSPTALGTYLEDNYNFMDKVAYGWDKFFDKTVKTLEGIFRRKS